MRLCLATTLATVLAVGCTSDTLDNTTYRRLVDSFDTYDQCIAEGEVGAPCYQTLTFCSDGRLNANLELRQEGKYKVSNDRAIAQLPTVTVTFYLDAQMSPQLPGRHPWELVEPLVVDCASH